MITSKFANPADPRRYGGRSEAVDEQGNPIPGTSPAQAAIDRYRGMAWDPVHKSAVSLDQTRSNEARAIGGGALDMLRARAMGAETPAQRLAQQQTQGAVQGIYSGAASIKGGAGARAAAARGAMGTASDVAARGAQDVQALRAREMADAAGQYMGASTAQRGQDLDIAGRNAQLEAEHRAAQDQREQFYEQKGFDAGNQDNMGKLGASAQDAQASSQSIRQDMQNQQRNNEFTGRMLGTGVSTAVGGVTAYGMARPGGQPETDPYKLPGFGSPGPAPDYNGTAQPDTNENVPDWLKQNMGSDARTKTNIRDLTTSDDKAKLQEAFDAGARQASQDDPTAGWRVSPEGVNYHVEDFRAQPEVPKQALSRVEPFVRREPAPAAEPEKAVGFSAKRPDGPMPEAMRSMDAAAYQYKPGFAEREGQTRGEHNVGPIAQKMAHDPVASTALVRDPHTGMLAIDKSKALKLTMGGLAALQRQIDELKGGRP
jgi:hypothetical protein